LGQGKGQLPAKEYIRMDRLIPILTHLSSHWTVPLSKQKGIWLEFVKATSYRNNLLSLSVNKKGFGLSLLKQHQVHTSTLIISCLYFFEGSYLNYKEDAGSFTFAVGSLMPKADLIVMTKSRPKVILVIILYSDLF
jgi:hypothetical protein